MCVLVQGTRAGQKTNRKQAEKKDEHKNTNERSEKRTADRKRNFVSTCLCVRQRIRPLLVCLLPLTYPFVRNEVYVTTSACTAGFCIPMDGVSKAEASGKNRQHNNTIRIAFLLCAAHKRVDSASVAVCNARCTLTDKSCVSSILCAFVFVVGSYALRLQTALYTTYAVYTHQHMRALASHMELSEIRRA